ncbi:uncharacterized protein JCM15063_004622 [Sporobolomyces koalae]|uniref:uncharacterized protein n=1 Tax=Sporobolomyces koalae TaxID=500713 RepID=UPI003173593A
MSTYPYRAKATLKYRPPPTQGASIAFDKGSIVTVLGAADEDGDWLEGENDQGVKGVFPATFVERIDDDDSMIQSGETSTSTELASEADTPSLPTTDVPAPRELEESAASISTATSSPLASSTSPPPAVAEPSSPAPIATSVNAPIGTTAKATPPPPAKKPNALAARIAAFNQSQSSSPSNSGPAPVPRPKPVSKWTVGSTSSSSTDTSPTTLTPSAPGSAPTQDPADSTSSAFLNEQDAATSADKPKEFSAEDAKESINRGGGSLRDRIKALQGLQMDQPAPPGRPPKPWKKKVVEEEPEQEPRPADPKPDDEDEPIVKDQEFKHDIETSQEQVPEIPGFEPAEPTPEANSDTRAEDSRQDLSGNQEQDAETVSHQQAASTESSAAAGTKPSSIELLSIAADSNPVVMTPGSASLELPSSPSPFIPSTDKTPASAETQDKAVEGEGESEAAKKSAIAARMAGLGGQKIGAVPIPALPKRAAGPRRAPRGASKPSPPPPAASEEPDHQVPETQIEQTRIGENTEQPQQEALTDVPVERSGSQEIENELVHPVAEKEDVLASMGGTSSLLQDQADESDEDAHNVPEEEDDFDTPAPPPPSRPVNPPPKTVELQDPQLADGEEQVDETEFAQREEPVQDDTTLGQGAVEALPTPATAEPVIEDNHEQPPPIPLNRPPVPPAFVRQVTDEPTRAELDQHRPTAEIDNPDEASYQTDPPPPPARPTKAPPIATGHETITDELRPSASAPDDLSNTIPQDQQQSVDVPAEVVGLGTAQQGENQKLPIPRHPAGPNHDKVTTEAEDRIMNELEVVTPPQEAFDESTAAPELDAPSVLDLAEVRDSHPTSSDLSQQALPVPSRQEGEASPAPVASPPRAASPAPPAEQSDNDEEEEEEDPEIARRRAIAARMAKLGGMSMRMGPMIPPMGMVMAAPKSKKVKKPEADEEADLPQARDLNEQVVESQSSGTVTPDHPARRYGGIPSGGFALPGIAAIRPPVKEQPAEVEAENQAGEEHTSSEASELIAEPAQAEAEETEENDEPASLEQEEVPPPLPKGRPLSMPPRRSVPVPEPEEELEQPEGDAADDQASLEQSQTFSEEPESGDLAPPPPPPARPAGGHQASHASITAVPSSPPSRPVPSSPSKRESTFSLGRTTTRGSNVSGGMSTSAQSMGFTSPKQSLDLAFDAERIQGGFAQGAFAARDLDLDTQTGNAWWRTQRGLPRSLQGRKDVALDFLNDAPGNTELEVIHEDYSRTVISVSYDPNDTTEATTSISQNHFAPREKPSLDVLLQYSATLGAQIFAAAHLKASDKSVRGITDEQFVNFCFGRATEPVPRIGSTFGAKVYEASSENKKGPAYAMDDEPRAGDVVVFHDVKLKQTLGSKTVGSHLAIVSGFEEKKAKLRVLEVDKNGTIDEGSYKLDDLKQGTIVVYRVLGKDYL